MEFEPVEWVDKDKKFYIRQRIDGKEYTANTIPPLRGLYRFPTLEAAVAWCEERAKEAERE